MSFYLPLETLNICNLIAKLISVINCPHLYFLQKSGLAKLRRVLRAIRKHFPQPPENISTQNAIDKFLDDPGLCENKLSEEAGSEGFLSSIMQVIFPNDGSLKQQTTSLIGR